MLMMHKSYVLARIDTLRGRQDLTTILQLTGEDPKHKGADPADPEPGSSKRKAGTSASSSKAQKSAEDLEDMSFSCIEKKGTMPKKKKASFAGGAQAAAVYGLRDWAEFTLLQEYLYINGKFQLRYVPKDGSCMWRAILEGTNYPAEYQSELLQRQVVLFMVENIDFIFPVLKKHVLGTYGCIRLSKEEYEKKEKDGSLTDIQKEDYLTPGPYSFLDYLLHLLERNSWGDYGVALSCSLMWQIRVTIVVVDTRGDNEEEWIRQELFRHEAPLQSADLVLVFCGGNHYVPAGKSRDELRSVAYGAEIAPLWSGDVNRHT